MNIHNGSVGELLRDWRQRRRLSQLAFACDAEISARHLSFIETGRSNPSRQMLLHLAELLDVPFRERNRLLLAAGYAPVYSETELESPDAEGARRAVDFILKAHEPFPALAFDRQWNLVAANAVVPLFFIGVAEHLLTPPINVLRLSLHPEGLASRIENLNEWRTHVFSRLKQQIETTGDEKLAALMTELENYPATAKPTASHHNEYGGLIVPLRLKSEAGTLSFYTTTTVFGTAMDITFSELVIESFIPGDTETTRIIRNMAEAMKDNQK